MIRGLQRRKANRCTAKILSRRQSRGTSGATGTRGDDMMKHLQTAMISLLPSSDSLVSENAMTSHSEEGLASRPAVAKSLTHLPE